MSNSARHLYEFGAFHLDPAERLLLHDGQPVPLTPKTFDTLVALVERSGRLVEKEELIKTVWPNSIVEEGNLSVTISMLRKALGADRDEHRYIETVSKRGYRFVVSVREVPWESKETNGGQMPATTGVISGQENLESPPSIAASAIATPAKRVLPLRPLWLSASLLLVVVAASLFFIWMATRKQTPVTGDSAILSVKSVAVLPFKTLGAKSDDEYLGLGIADTLITKLGSTGQLVVRPYSAILKYTNPADDPNVIGQQQGVDAVLDGRMQREGERVRVNVALLRVSDGVPLWHHTFDEKFTNIFAVQDAISEKVAQTIQLQLSGAEKKLLSKRFTENTEATQAYAKGRFFWNKRTEEGLNKGAEYFQEAIALDSNYAQAQVGLADSYSMLGVYTVIPPNEAYPKAQEAAKKALDMDEELAEAHATLGAVSFYYDWDGAAAEKHFQRTFQINPNYAIAHMWYGLSLAAMGRLSEAREEMRQAQKIDPLSLIINTNVGWPLHLEGQYDEAIAAYQKALEIDPNFARAHFRIGLAYEQKKMYEQAIAAFQKATHYSGNNPEYEALVGHAYALSGKKERARRMLANLMKRSERQYVPPYSIALIYLGLNEKERALEWLEKAFIDRSSGMVILKVDPMLNSLRTEPRFVELSRKLKF